MLKHSRLLAILSALLPMTALAQDPTPVTTKIYVSQTASPLEQFAAREVRRYIYLRTGRLLQIQAINVGEWSEGVYVFKSSPTMKWLELEGGPELRPTPNSLREDECDIISVKAKGKPLLILIGGSDVATLYAAYRFAEHLGVRFYLEGDVVPEGKTELKLTGINERRAPLFELRGIQPFHDFPEGPDWWEADDYRAILAQLAKLGMNFIGLHTYPEGHPMAEPTVWIGPADEVNTDGTVKASYASSYQNTVRTSWGYTGQKTGEFVFGSAALFERDDYGPAVMRDACPQPDKPEMQNEVFDRTAAMLRDAFTFAHQLGIKTCVGTETPLTVPKALQARLPAGQDVAARTQSLYEGIFTRIQRAYPIDYYWLWTPEGWTWQGVKPEVVQATLKDIQIAAAAAAKVNAPFRLATCGWVLGPQYDRSMFDRELPKDIALSCINREVGKTPVEPGFANVQRKDKWAIPWMEDDPALTSVQLWAGRMRRDAFDAREYGCNGLLGIHWRTRALGPNVSALAAAAWDQSGWKKQEPAQQTGPFGGEVTEYAQNQIADTEDDPLYRSVRYGMSAYCFAVPNGAYRVTLKFCEIHYNEAGKRVFGVKLQGKQVIEHLDIFAKVGKDRVLDYTFKDLAVTNGRLDIDFVNEVEHPCISAIVVEGSGFTTKINCGAGAYKDYAADPPPPARDLPIADFYADWAAAHFGPEAAAEIAAIFTRLDGHMPRPTGWVHGPGGVQPDQRPWIQVRPEYAFVDELSLLRDRVKGAGNRERFDYWLGQFRYMRAIAFANCLWAELNAAMDQVRKEQDPQEKKTLAREVALSKRRGMLYAVKEVFGQMLPLVSNTGEMGTIDNLNRHCLPAWLPEKVDKELTDALGEPLPPEARLIPAYTGRARVIVPTVRTSLVVGEPLTLKVILLGEPPDASAASAPAAPVPARSGASDAGNAEAIASPSESGFYWRSLGKGDFQRIPLEHVARGVYRVTLPAACTADDFEYYVEAKWPATTDSAGTTTPEQIVRFPATAPDLNQTVVVMPAK